MVDNLRRVFRRKKDRELSRIIGLGESIIAREQGRVRYRSDELTVVIAQEISDTRYRSTVARAVVRERVESGQGHDDIRNYGRVKKIQERHGPAAKQILRGRWD